jgi:hypothetical protein
MSSNLSAIADTEIWSVVELPLQGERAGGAGQGAVPGSGLRLEAGEAKPSISQTE